MILTDGPSMAPDGAQMVPSNSKKTQVAAAGDALLLPGR